MFYVVKQEHFHLVKVFSTKARKFFFFISFDVHLSWKRSLKYIDHVYIKTGLSPSKNFFFICFNESPLKLMKNYFYFMLKALFVLKVIILESYRFGYVQKLRKLMLISKFMTSQPGQKIISIHILPNISRSKSNHTIKFDQSIEYNMINIFYDKSYIKCRAHTKGTEA